MSKIREAIQSLLDALELPHDILYRGGAVSDGLRAARDLDHYGDEHSADYTHELREQVLRAAIDLLMEAVLRVRSDQRREIIEAMSEFTVTGDDHPFLSEAGLYDRIGKDDARALLHRVDKLRQLG